MEETSAFLDLLLKCLEHFLSYESVGRPSAPSKLEDLLCLATNFFQLAVCAHELGTPLLAELLRLCVHGCSLAKALGHEAVHLLCQAGMALCAIALLQRQVNGLGCLTLDFFKSILQMLHHFLHGLLHGRKL